MKAFSTLLLLASSLHMTSGFAPAPVPSHSHSPSQLNSVLDRNVASFDLPKNALPFREEEAKAEALMKVEVGIGRVAMVAALVFCGVEVTTDMSIPEQLATLSMLV